MSPVVVSTLAAHIWKWIALLTGLDIDRNVLLNVHGFLSQTIRKLKHLIETSILPCPFDNLIGGVVGVVLIASDIRFKPT